MSTPQKFSLDISAFVTKAKGNMDKVVRKVVLDIGARIVLRSPVGDGMYWKHPPPKGYTGGRFRANWQYGEGDVPVGTFSDIDKSGMATIGKMVAAIKPGAAWKVHYITNNLPYAMRLEQGWSKRQAPAGMVVITLVEFQGIVRDAAAEAKAK